MSFDLADGINWYVVFLFSTTVHEAAHAWVAHRLGDDTAYRGGQVSLDPTPHIKRAPIGMVVVPILSYLFAGSLIGWAHAPYQRAWALQYPRRCAVMALAGPLANFSLAIVALLLIRVGCEWQLFRISSDGAFSQMVLPLGAPDGWAAFFAKLLSICLSLNVLLGTFNLIPLPPLDGSQLPLLVLPQHVAESYWAFFQNPTVSWMGMFGAWKIFGWLSPLVFESTATLLWSISPH